jgi:hypothetical protein
MPHLQVACSSSTRAPEQDLTAPRPSSNPPLPQWHVCLYESFTIVVKPAFPPCRDIPARSCPEIVSQVPRPAECWTTRDRSRSKGCQSCGLLAHAGCHPVAFSDITVAIGTMIATKFNTFLSASGLGHAMPHALGEGIPIRFLTGLVRSIGRTSSFYSLLQCRGPGCCAGDCQ